MKKMLLILFLVAGFFALERLCHKATDGFALNKVIYPLKEELAEKLEPFSVEHKHAKDILTNRSFRYLASGAQCYAFVSDDQKYILKLFKFQHMRIPPWSQHLPLPSFLDSYRQAKLAKKRQIISDLFDSFQLASRYLKEETGILFLHLRKTSDFESQMTIIDKIGKQHRLDIDQTYFVLQMRADLAYDKINDWMKKGKIAKARAGIRSLVNLAATRCEKGIFDKDPDFRTNFGFVNGKATQIDIGRFSKKRIACDKTICQPEIIRITRAFRQWLRKNHEALVDVLDEEVNKIMQDNGAKRA